MHLRSYCEVAGDCLKGHWPTPVLIPDSGVWLLHHATRLSVIDVINIELIGVPSFDFVQSIPLGHRSTIVKFIREFRDRRSCEQLSLFERFCCWGAAFL